MKFSKKLMSLLLAAFMMLAMAVPSFAADPPSIVITNNNEHVSMNGHTYSAYKVLDLSWDGGSAYTYTINSAFEDYFTAEGINNDNVTDYFNKTEEELIAISRKLNKFITDSSIAPAKTATGTTAGTVTIDLSAAGYGHYLVTDKAPDTGSHQELVLATLSLTTTNAVGGISLKADAPSIDKKINENGTLVDSNNVSIGKPVDYVLTSHVPDMTYYDKYYFCVKDQLTKGLTLDASTIKVYVGNAELTAEQYTVTANDYDAATGTYFEVLFKNFIQYKGQTGAEIKVTYTATLNENAIIGVVGNPNDVWLTYSNDPNYEFGGEPSDEPGSDTPTGTTPKDTVITYTTAIGLEKVDQDGETLPGAQFTIEGTALMHSVVTGFMFEQDNTYTATTPNAYVLLTDNKGYALYADLNTASKETYKDGPFYKRIEYTDDLVENVTVNEIAEVNEQGLLIFKGLGEGTYTIKEIKAPNGYNLLKNPIVIKIDCNTSFDVTPTNYSQPCAWTLTSATMGSETLTAENILDASGTKILGTFQFTVENNTGTELPGTGGMGTTIFVVAGLILMLGAAVLLITKRKVSAEK